MYDLKLTQPNLAGMETTKYSSHKEFLEEYKNLPDSMKWKTKDTVSF
jgi:hypothetical protein